MVSEVTCTRFTGPKRRLPKSATRHDPRARLTAEIRSSPVPGSVLLRSLCVCRAFRHLAVPETPEGRLATSLGAAASHEDLAISACRIAPERRTCVVQATLLETSTRAPWFVIDVLPRKPGVVPPLARRPRPLFRHRPAKAGSFQKTKGAFHRTHAAGIAPD